MKKISKTSNRKTGFRPLNEDCLHAEFIGKIRDSLHGTIPFTKYERIVIDSPEFQRLRRVNQTAFIKYVFPGSTHTRFEHSLGVMHVAGLLYAALLSNQRYLLVLLKNLFHEVIPTEVQKSFLQNEEQRGSILQTAEAVQYLGGSAYLAQCFRFAALLHDCGHGPFSHSGEKFLISWGDLEIQLPDLQIPAWLQSALKNKIEKKKSTHTFFSEESVSHEIYTLFIIARIFKYDELFLSSQMGRDVCAVIDLDISPEQNGDLEKSGLQNLLHEMISGEIDVDRMDYLLRDSMECGVVYGYFDLDRILDSVGFYFDPSTGEYHLAMRKSGVSAFEDYLRARLSMYHQVYFHKTATACEAMLEHLKRKSPDFVFPLCLDDYLKLDDSSFISYFTSVNGISKNKYIEQILNDLILDRKLWKLVYEESLVVNPSADETESLCPYVLNLLKSENIPCEMVETKTNLTCFFPIEMEKKSKNKFKIILKDIHTLRYLDPIENHSLLINQPNRKISIKRIFISRYKENGKEIDINSVQKTISERINNA